MPLSGQYPPTKVVVVRHERSSSRELLATMKVLGIAGIVILGSCGVIVQEITKAIPGPGQATQTSLPAKVAPRKPGHLAAASTEIRPDTAVKRSKYAECDKTTPNSEVRKLCEGMAADEAKAKLAKN